jgi:hypothetical protein
MACSTVTTLITLSFVHAALAFMHFTYLAPLPGPEPWDAAVYAGERQDTIFAWVYEEALVAFTVTLAPSSYCVWSTGAAGPASSTVCQFMEDKTAYCSRKIVGHPWTSDPAGHSSFFTLTAMIVSGGRILHTSTNPIQTTTLVSTTTQSELPLLFPGVFLKW